MALSRAEKLIRSAMELFCEGAEVEAREDDFATTVAVEDSHGVMLTFEIVFQLRELSSQEGDSGTEWIRVRWMIWPVTVPMQEVSLELLRTNAYSLCSFAIQEYEDGSAMIICDGHCSLDALDGEQLRRLLSEQQKYVVGVWEACELANERSESA